MSGDEDEIAKNLDSGDEEIAMFANETSVSSQSNFQNISMALDEENVQDKTFKPRKDITENESNESDFDLEGNIDFVAMQKSTDTKEYGFVIHNDLDLKDLRKAFVRSKNIKFSKLKTEEHSESGSSEESSSGESDSDVEINQGKFCYNLDLVYNFNQIKFCNFVFFGLFHEIFTSLKKIFKIIFLPEKLV